MKRIIIVLLITLMSVVLISADGVDDQGNPNNPNTNDRANACFEGGDMEGKCDTPWEWMCGWHLIRLHPQDVASRAAFPSVCVSLLRPLVQSIVQDIVVDAVAVNDAISVTNGGNLITSITINDRGGAPIVVLSFGDSIPNVGTTPADGVTILAIAAGGGTIDVIIDANGSIDITATGTTGTGSRTIYYEIQVDNGTTDIAQVEITFGP